MKRKIRLGILFGGRSSEHEVSLASARAVIAALDSDRYEVVPIGITKQGAWLIGEVPTLLQGQEVSPEIPDTLEVVADVTRQRLVPMRPGSIQPHESAVDVVFPLIHGPYGEDGTVQGLLELADIPYVGAGVLASSVGMDKAMMKTVFEHAGLPVVPYRWFSVKRWQTAPDEVIAEIESALEYPVFVKPCNLGSSVGISKARTRDELWTAVQEAARYDRKIIIEKGVNAREVECAILGNDDPTVSVFGEIVPHHEFYDYEAKYTEGLTDYIIPARLSAEQVRTLTDMALCAFHAIDAAGMARVDFFIERSSERLILNEINTIPGFTPTSMYPKLWEASGLSYSELIDRLIELALERHAEKKRRSL
jgi:D-alanine-D-alanine ligase